MLTVKQKFSHLGFSIALYTLISNLLSAIVVSIYEVVTIVSYMVKMSFLIGADNMPTDSQYYMNYMDQIPQNSTVLLLASSLPAYLVAVPITLWFLNSPKFRDVPLKGLSFMTPYEKSQKRDLSIGEFFTFLLIAISFGAIGSLISAALSGLYSLATGKNMNNLLDSLLTNMPLGSVIIITVILAPIFEELLYRYGVVGYCRRYGEWNAIIISGIIFGLIHTNIFQFFYAFLLGCLFAYIYIYTRQIKYTIALHMLFNFFGAGLPLMLSCDGAVNTALIIYYVCFFSLAVVGIVLLVLYKNSGKIYKPTGKTPVPGYFSKDSILNAGMITMFIICLVLTVYIQFFAPTSIK